MKSIIACCTALLIAGTAFGQHDQSAPKKPDMPKQVQDAGKKAEEGMKHADHADHANANKPAGGPSEAEMKAWMEAATPGEQHQMLAKMAGEWTAVTKMFDPSMGESEGKGTMRIEMVMGGRYQHSFYKGDFMGQPFEGAGFMGYDNVTKKFQSTWGDTMSTMIMMSTGDYNKDTHELVMTSECTDPVSKKTMPTREVSKFIDDNHWTMTFFQTKDGKESKMMEINYTRKAAAAASPAAEKSAMDKAKEEAMKKAKEAGDKMKDKLPGR